MKKIRVILAGLLVMGLIISLSGCGTTASKATNESKETQKVGTKEDALAFYNGKTLNYIVPYATGGGYDLYARLVVPYLQKYIPGTTVVIRNIDGGGGLIGTNELYMSKADGLTFGIVNGIGVLTSQVVGQQGVKYDLTKMIWLARYNNEPKMTVVNATTPYKTIDDLKNTKTPLKFGVSGVGSSEYIGLEVTKKLFVPTMDIIPGYNNNTEADVAMLRGEVVGTSGSLSSKQALLDQKKVTPVLFYGPQKDPNFPNVPLATDLLSDKDKEFAQGYINLLQLGRGVGAPPGVPEERVALLREAFQKALSDPELLDKAKAQKLDIQYLSGPDEANIIKQSLQMPADLKDLMSKALTSK